MARRSRLLAGVAVIRAIAAHAACLAALHLLRLAGQLAHAHLLLTNAAGALLARSIRLTLPPK
jgi:hypothetical protein